MTLILPFPDDSKLGQQLAHNLAATLGAIEWHRFPDHESLITLKGECAGRDAIIVCTLNDGDLKTLPLYFAAATARELGARRVGLVAPYLAYMRQDHRFRAGQSRSAHAYAELLSTTFDWLAAVDLQPEGLQQLYQLLKRSPRAQQQALLEEQLAALQSQSDWLGSFVGWVRSQLAAQRSIAPLKLDDAQHNADLLKALSALAELTTPTLERSLSTRLFGDSKRLESLRSALLSVLRRHDPAAPEFGDDDWALLRSHKLDRAPEYLALAGPLNLELQTGERITLGAIEPSIALSAASLPKIKALESQAERLISVENATSFNELLLQRPANWLLVYTGGFASPSLIELLSRIRQAQPQMAHSA